MEFMLLCRAVESGTDSLLIKGADYLLNETAGFEDLKNRVAGISSELGLQTTIMETNLREFMTNYKMQHAGMLASCLHCLGAIGFAHGAYAADYPRWQEIIAFPWGNLSGIADTLTTQSFPISHVGEEFGRSEKIKRIAVANPNCFRICQYAGATRPAAEIAVDVRSACERA